MSTIFSAYACSCISLTDLDAVWHSYCFYLSVWMLKQYKDITKIRWYGIKFNLWNTTKSQFIICLYSTIKKVKYVFLNLKIFSYQIREFLSLLFALIISRNIFTYFLNLHQGKFKSYEAHFMQDFGFKFYSQTIKRQSILLKWYF